MANLTDFAIDALAVHRLTRLATADVVTRPWRTRVIRAAYARSGSPLALHAQTTGEAEADALPHNDDNAPKLATLVTCPWCVSIYIAAGVLAVRRFAPGFWQAASYGLALSTAAALVANREEPKR